jgi:hypothetical protein
MIDRLVEHRRDRRPDDLDVPVLLGGDVRDQVIERAQLLAATEAKRLERVVHQGRHLAEAPAHQLLHGHGAGGIGVTRGDFDAESDDRSS